VRRVRNPTIRSAFIASLCPVYPIPPSAVRPYSRCLRPPFAESSVSLSDPTIRPLSSSSQEAIIASGMGAAVQLRPPSPHYRHRHTPSSVTAGTPDGRRRAICSAMEDLIAPKVRAHFIPSDICTPRYHTLWSAMLSAVVAMCTGCLATTLTHLSSLCTVRIGHHALNQPPPPPHPYVAPSPSPRCASDKMSSAWAREFASASYMC
jgi:hypothetical protein